MNSLVKCKDCKNWRIYTHDVSIGIRHYCDYWSLFVKADQLIETKSEDFCSHGEKDEQ